MKIEDLLASVDSYPVMGERMNDNNSIEFDFGPTNEALKKADFTNTSEFNAFIFKLLREAGKPYGFGGYFENRIIYQRSSHFQEIESRSIHLGVDVWTNPLHKVYAPLEGTVHSFQNNDNFGDYGPTIILEHHVENHTFYSLYGHLSLASLEHISEGDLIKKGSDFCEIGGFPENGDWPPHLHFQLITNLGGKKGDFPGVCAPSEMEKYRKLCPNPISLI